MKSGDLDEEQAEAHLAALSEDLAACGVIEIRKPVIASARELVRVHALRAYDAVQLAAALRSRSDSALTFLCADRELADAAEAERLRVELLG